MREGVSPLDAVNAVLERLVDSYELKPTHQVGLIALAVDGTWSSASLRPDYRTSVTTATRNEFVDPDYVALS